MVSTSAPHWPEHGGKKILVVEDDPQIGEILESLLADLGHGCTRVLDACAAINLLEARAGSFDILLTDVLMAGLNGVELARMVGTRWPHMKVILVTGESELPCDEMSEGILILLKPYSIHTLASLVGVNSGRA